MPALNWIGKEQIINHDKEVPFRLLKMQKQLSVGENSENLVICGDNLEALKALMPFYYNKIKCIYIDPPYNTGNEQWVFNDKVNSPKIREWLGKVVGGDTEDLTRHDKWLCMMCPRLKLLRDLLADDGVILVSIDDNELYNLRALMDEIFNEENFIATLIWKKKAGGGSDAKFFAVDHEYVLIYAKNILNQKNYFVKITEKLKADYKYKDKNFDKFGPYKRKNLYQPGIETDRPNLRYPVACPDGTKLLPPTIWRWGKETFLKAKKDGRIEFVFDKKKKKWNVYTKMYLFNHEGEEYKIKPRSILVDVGMTKDGNIELEELFGKKMFTYPKPTKLIKYLISIVTNGNDIILDSFAGSGTTGHAVLELNKGDKSNRKFILVELEEKICKEVTVERLRKVIKKLGSSGFQFCELGKPLFDENGQIDESCSFNDLARYIFFTETKTNLDVRKINKSFIGAHNEIDYYLLFNGEKHTNILNRSFLKTLPKKGQKIIYADQCLVDDETLEKHNAIFKQIPYEVKVY